jgi:molecular chaperone IbpA
MRNTALTNLFPYSVGFDHFDQLFDWVTREGSRDLSYPPYNIMKTDEDKYRITMAVAGFTEDDLELVTKDNVLTVRGKVRKQDEGVQYLHRGMAGRAFEHSFRLADHVRVMGASLADGVLSIELVREIPEAMRPQRIQINTGPAPRVIEHDQQSGQAA